MKLVFFNGSPKGPRAHTLKMTNYLMNAFMETPGNTVEVHNIFKINDQETYRKAFLGADIVGLGFPLYTDSMPGQVMTFIEETLQPMVGRPKNPAIFFLVQSGFPEALHGRHVEIYLEKLAARMGCRYLGSIIRGGAAGYSNNPPSTTKGISGYMYQLGLDLGKTGEFDAQKLQNPTGPEKFGFFFRLVMGLVEKTGVLYAEWDQEMKKNGSFEHRNAQPYKE
ncbi:MAG TPA: NAD(P)H-dependent oxidoreductase [Longilinea sp.]|nr:NAD(P)H-dependent oxidoreductase [Longilinea sp.]